MNVSISRIWRPTSEEWDQAWLTCPYSTYFHSREWSEMWSEYQPNFSPAPLAFELSNGVRVVFPLAQESILKGLGKRYITSPAGTCGGWLCTRHLTDVEQLQIIHYIFRKYSNITWRLNPYSSITQPIPAQKFVKDETHTLALDGGFEKIYKGWTKGHASAARKARNAGVTIKLAERDGDWDGYYQVYVDSHQRWGEKATGLYSRALFKILFDRKSSNIKLWLAYHEGRIIAGAVCFYSRTNVIYWHGAALASFFNLRPVNLLIYEAIKDAVEKGYDWFDFNPSGGLEGVASFKKSFGAMPKSSNVYSSTSSSQKCVRVCASFLTALRGRASRK